VQNSLKKSIVIGFLVLLNLPVWGQNETNLIAPLELPFSLSGTFGEPRNTHFHLGIDVKTKGKEGWKVKSVAEGYISRIRVSLGGYGKTLYINHPDQTTSVYAHLKKFAPKIESYVKEMQYEKESYTLQQFPKKDKFRLGAGEVIAFSGNTGSSSGPHLHFEIRDTKTQKPINPLLFDLPVMDSQRPQIQKLFLFYPRNENILVHSEPVALQKKNDSTYTTRLIKTSGQIGIGLQMFDRQDLSYSKNGIFKAHVKVNGVTIANYEFDQLDYSDSDKLFIMVDYPNFVNQKVKIQKMFFQNHEPLTFIKFLKNEGVFDIAIGKSYLTRIEIEDFSGNSSSIEMYIEGASKKIPKNSLEGKLIEPQRDYLFEWDDKEIYFPKKTFFGNAILQMEGDENLLSIGPDLFPFQKEYEIRFKVNPKDSIHKKQTFIAKKNENRLMYLPTSIKENYWITKVKGMGDYTLARDSIAPKIQPLNFKPNQWLSKFKFIRIKISDDFSGIKSYRGTINGEWVLFEYEPKRKELTYQFSDKIFNSTKHELRLEVEDNTGNKAIYETSFLRKYNLE